MGQNPGTLRRNVERVTLMAQGPNVKKLIASKMSVDAVPSGGGLKDALSFITSKEKIIEGAKKATAWVEEAIKMVREAKEPNEWKNADDETIACEILRQIEARKKANNG